jgi:hypothetical protein
MKGLWQRLWRGTIAMSLLLCLASAAMWVRSEFVGDAVRHYVYVAGPPPPSASFWLDPAAPVVEYGQVVDTYLGEVWFDRWQDAFDPKDRGLSIGPLGQDHWRYNREHPMSYRAFSFATWLGFWDYHPSYINKMASNYLIPVQSFGVPFWLIVTMFAILPGFWVIAFFRRRIRHRPGFCRNCGYDLRATPDRCPECGTAPPKQHPNSI